LDEIPLAFRRHRLKPNELLEIKNADVDSPVQYVQTFEAHNVEHSNKSSKENVFLTESQVAKKPFEHYKKKCSQITSMKSDMQNMQRDITQLKRTVQEITDDIKELKKFKATVIQWQAKSLLGVLLETRFKLKTGLNTDANNGIYSVISNANDQYVSESTGITKETWLDMIDFLGTAHPHHPTRNDAMHNLVPPQELLEEWYLKKLLTFNFGCLKSRMKQGVKGGFAYLIYQV
jgi:ElaB/YqjD/DUF883 family membrane-anchored ribosome-binding protein